VSTVGGVYRETPPPAALRGLVECAWSTTGGPGGRVLPDGCMDLLLSPDGTVSVAGPDTAAFVVTGSAEWTAGVRFHPGALPRLLGVPAVEVRDLRAPVETIAPGPASLVQPLRSAGASAGSGGRARRRGTARGPAVGDPAATAPDLMLDAVARLVAEAPEERETAPWSLPALAHVTRRLGGGARVEDLADELGWSPRSLTRQCTAVFGYGPATLRRILRFRRAGNLLHAGVAPAEVAAVTGYADQPHLAREVKALAGVPASALRGPE